MVTNPIVSSLETYVEQHKSELLRKTILGSDNESRSLFDLMVDVKGPTTLNIADYDVQFQPLSCSWQNSGSTTYSQRMLEPQALMVETDYCIANLLQTYAQTEVKIGAGRMNAGSFEEAWVDGVIDGINAGIEKMIYQGKLADSAATNEFQGLISILSGDATSIKVEETSGTTAYEFLKNVLLATPVEVKNVSILVSPSLYREYCLNLVEANLFHYNVEDGKPGYPIPGSDVRVIPVAGLEGAGADYAIATNLEKNIVFGVSANEDIDAIDVYFDRASKSLHFDWQAVMGVQVAFPDQTVIGKRG